MSKLLLGRICRTCLEKSADMHKLREFIEDDLQIEDMLTQAVPDFDLEIDDTPLPVEICDDCLDKLRVSFNFHRKCMETNQQLREMLAKNEEEDETPAELNEILKGDDILMDNLKKEPLDDASNESNNLTNAPMTEFADVLSPSFQIDPVKLELSIEDDDKMGGGDSGGDSSDDYWPDDDKDDSESNILVNKVNTSADNMPKRKYHRKKPLNRGKTKTCSECNKTFAKRNLLIRHKSVHSMENEFVCKICQYRYSNARRLKTHMSSKHMGLKITLTGGPYPCPDCPQVFEQTRALAAHRVMHMERDFKCEVCGTNCKTMAAVTRHMHIKHPDILPHKCQMCDKAFAVESHLNDHINEHLGQKKYKCDKCEKSFPNTTALKDHSRSHTGESPYLCSHCGKSFKTGNVLRDHMQRHGEKNVQCPECPMKFYSKVGLTKHMTTHSKVKCHVCDECGSAYTRQDSLKAHKFKHTGLRPFKCEECNLSFVFKGHFRKHQIIHAGTKPHQCTYCDRAYASSGDLVKHLRTHVGEKTYFCDECPEAFKYLSDLKDHKNQHYKNKLSLQKIDEDKGKEKNQMEIDDVKPELDVKKKTEC